MNRAMNQTTETRYQRVAREQRERQAAREKRLKDARKAQRARGLGAQIRAQHEAGNREADRIDGYDRDDLGLSPDF